MRKVLSFLYHTLPLICGGLLALFGGVLGGIDAGNPGLGVGAVVGLLVGTAIGFLFANLLALAFGRKATADPKHQGSALTETPPQRARRYVFRTLVIVVLAVVLHDCYWFGCMWMSGVNYNAGAYMTRAAAQNYSRSQLQRDLQDHRWRHDVLAARPLKWMFADEAEILNQANREIINVVTDKTIVKPGMRLKDMPTTVELADLWRSGYWFAPSVTDRSLSNYGMAVCSATAGKLEKHQSRGLILRFLPKAWFR